MQDKVKLNQNSIPLYLFAKAPIPGKVKTRMQPELNQAGCAELAKIMLRQSMQMVVDHWPGRLVLCVSPETDHIEFTGLAATYACELVEQVGCNLGDRMLHALNSGIASSGTAIVMGCDVPHITAQILTTTYQKLQHTENVIGPAEDGGFYLLGLQEIRPEIFNDIDWGTDTVMEQVIAQATACGLRLSRLPELRDIDRWQDLLWLAERDIRYRSFVEPDLN